MIVLIALFGLVVGNFDLTLGYPAQLNCLADTSCVVDVYSSVGASLMRVFADVSLLNDILPDTLNVTVGRYRDGSPSTTSGSGSTVESSGDITVSVDHPTLAGVSDKFWIVVTASDDVTVLLTATCYDVQQRPRVPAVFNERTGLIQVEDGAYQVFNMFVQEQTAPINININIDKASFSSIFDSYDIYVKIITKATILAEVKNVDWQDLASVLASLGSVFTGGVVTDLPDQLNPGPMNNDMQLSANLITSDASFAVPTNMGDMLIAVSIYVHKASFIPFDGTTAYFNVKFSLGDDDGDPHYQNGTCAALSKRSVADIVEVESATNPCADVECRTCVANAQCQYCFSAPGTGSKCQPAGVACPGTPSTSAASADQCVACILHTDNVSCTADATANYCQWCGLVSAGVPQIGCTDMWTCAEGAALMTTTTTTTTTAVGATPAASASGSSTAGLVATNKAGSGSQLTAAFGVVIVMALAMIMN